MPTYDYICPDCGHESERLVPIAERDNQTCPHAEEEMHDGPGLMDREISSPAIECHIEGSRLSSSRPGSRPKK